MPKKKKTTTTSDCTEVYDENLFSHAFSRFYYFYLFFKILRSSYATVESR